METKPMSLIVPCSIVVLVKRQRVYLTVHANNWSDEFNYLICIVDKCSGPGYIIEYTCFFFLSSHISFLLNISHGNPLSCRSLDIYM